MEPQAAEYEKRLLDEIRTLNVRQVRTVLGFVEGLKRGPTEETLLQMLGRSGVPVEEIEDVYSKLLLSGSVTPQLLRTLRGLAAAKAHPDEEERISALMERNREGTAEDAEREELRRLVASGERMNLTRAGALLALKLLTGNLLGST